jgi:hypothetical protein
MRSPLFALLLAPLCASCAEGASVNVKTAPGFTPGPATVSVLGVFRDGRMSTDAWTPLGPPLSTALGQVADLCEVAYGERLQQEQPDLYTFLEEDTRMNGITEDMLVKLAPKAEGELILTVTIHGRIIQAAPDHDDMPPQSAPALRPGAGRTRPGVRASASRGVAPGGLQFAASLFSVPKQKSVARLNMSYTGTSVEDAFRRFAAELSTVVPGGTCRGWKWRDASKVPGAGLP